MTDSFSSLRINPDRMLDTFNQLALIGATGDGGVNRPTFSESHLTARKWFREQIAASGLEFRTDGAPLCSKSSRKALAGSDRILVRK